MSAIEEPTQLLTIDQVASLCQVSTKTVYRAIRRGALRASRLGAGGAYRGRPEAMERGIDARAQPAARRSAQPPGPTPQPRPPPPRRAGGASLGRAAGADAAARARARAPRPPVLNRRPAHPPAGNGTRRVIEQRKRRRHNGTTYTAYRVRWKDDAGVQRCRTFYTERDALDFEAKVRLARRGDDLASLDAGRQTLSEFAAEWWALDAGPNLERATLRSYASHWNCHVLPRLGHLQLRRITPDVVVRFRADLEADDVGDEAVRRTLAMLQAMLARAVEWQRIPSNPVKAIRKPRVKRKRAVQAVPPLLVEHLRKHYRRAGRADHATLVSVLAYAGVRPEEALALQWRHVRDRTLLVEQKNVDGEILTGQKTGRPPRTIELMVALRHDLLEFRLTSGRPGPDDLLFPTTDGRPWREHDYRNWRRRHYRPGAEACGLGPRPYDLRHSFASLRIQEGRLTIVELAEQLGHSPTMTLNTYAHVIAEFRGGGRVDPDALIAEARAAVHDRERVAHGPQKDPTTKKAGVGAGLDQAELPIAIGEPSAGLEPATPSLPWKCSTN